MAAKRFKSKVDRWIIVLLVIVIVAEVFAIGSAALQASDPLVTTAMILLGTAIAALIVWLTLGTYYVVDRGKLIVVAGPIRWNVPIEQISSVEATKSPLSSPALSLDRLRIRYGKNRRIMISPADKAGFLKAIGHAVSPT
ncbi:MAG: PH domain-containing protein [Gammaproteobacteria bacterium]|nr:PH domain-containing protein [Gammaproteobacteria bacterium]MDH3373168.1 PH domain-containing protein [Gammaproteobacteria bacterium]MDH3410091.1 PH domain-containing protein [Gammaproteobacteria bacterium]MDH3551426.1 PH domain-containing protein [Gammaproteobacteria bacterium]